MPRNITEVLIENHIDFLSPNQLAAVERHQNSLEAWLLVNRLAQWCRFEQTAQDNPEIKATAQYRSQENHYAYQISRYLVAVLRDDVNPLGTFRLPIMGADEDEATLALSETELFWYMFFEEALPIDTTERAMLISSSQQALETIWNRVPELQAVIQYNNDIQAFSETILDYLPFVASDMFVEAFQHQPVFLGRVSHLLSLRYHIEHQNEPFIPADNFMADAQAIIEGTWDESISKPSDNYLETEIETQATSEIETLSEIDVLPENLFKRIPNPNKPDYNLKLQALLDWSLVEGERLKRNNRVSINFEDLDAIVPDAVIEVLLNGAMRFDNEKYRFFQSIEAPAKSQVTRWPTSEVLLMIIYFKFTAHRWGGGGARDRERARLIEDLRQLLQASR